MMPYLAIGLFGGYLIRMVLDRHEREKSRYVFKEAYRSKCDAMDLLAEARRREKSALDAAEFVESVLLIETKPITR